MDDLGFPLGVRLTHWISALLTIMVVRRRVWQAWVGVIVILVSGSFWIGIPATLSLGAVGAIVWVGIAQLVTGLMARSARDTAELTELQRTSSEWLASQDGRRRERHMRHGKQHRTDRHRSHPVPTPSAESPGGTSAIVAKLPSLGATIVAGRCPTITRLREPPPKGCP